MMRSFALAGLLLSIATLVFGQTPKTVPDIDIEQRLNERVPLDLVFRDETGAAVPLRKYFDERPVVLVLAYYRCPRLCSVVLNNLTGSFRKLDHRIGKDFTVLTVSIDPRETHELAAAKKTAYLDLYGDPSAADGWHFLTGDEPAIAELARSVGYRYSYDPRKDEYAHSSGIMVLTPEGKIARYFFGLTYPERDLRYGIEDASAGKIGSPMLQPVRLMCFTYDPTTGQYTLLTMRLVRIGGVLTLVGLGGFWLWSWWRGRRRA